MDGEEEEDGGLNVMRVAYDGASVMVPMQVDRISFFPPTRSKSNHGEFGSATSRCAAAHR